MPQNPIVNADFPDPCIVATPDGIYYAYATHDIFSPTSNNILVRHSTDLIHWPEAEGALAKMPAWAKEAQQFWSPHVVHLAGEYRMYSAAHPDAGSGMALAMARSKAPYWFYRLRRAGVITDAAGQEWTYYHALDTTDRFIPGTDLSCVKCVGSAFAMMRRGGFLWRTRRDKK